MRPRASSRHRELSRPAPESAVPSSAGSFPWAPSRPSSRAARAEWTSDSAFKLHGWIASVGDSSFTAVGYADDVDDDVDIEVPLDFVAPSQRPLVRAGTQITWTVTRYRLDEERIRSDSALRLAAATPLSDAELRAAARRAEAYKDLLDRFPARPDDLL